MEKQNSDFINDYSLKARIKSDLNVWYKIWYPDLVPAHGINPKIALKLIWNYLGLRATLLYRLSYHLQHKKIKVLPGILTRLNITLHGFDVPSNVDIGPGLYVPHPVGIVIMARRIGSNLSLIGSNTIGMRNAPAYPVLGNNVFLGTGARVLGDIVIGDNVNIGANAVVIRDVPSNSTAVGVPAKILARE